MVTEYGKALSIKSGIHELLYDWYGPPHIKTLTDDSVLELPVKISYFASLFVVANARKPDIGKDILDFSITKVKEVLEQGDFIKGKLMLRFLAGLGRIIEEDGIIQVIGKLVSKIEGQEANVYISLNLLIIGEDG